MPIEARILDAADWDGDIVDLRGLPAGVVHRDFLDIAGRRLGAVSDVAISPDGQRLTARCDLSPEVMAELEAGLARGATSISHGFRPLAESVGFQEAIERSQQAAFQAGAMPALAWADLPQRVRVDQSESWVVPQTQSPQPGNAVAAILAGQSFLNTICGIAERAAMMAAVTGQPFVDEINSFCDAAGQANRAAVRESVREICRRVENSENQTPPTVAERFAQTAENFCGGECFKDY